MPTITDWLMVIITGIYVIATIAICWANIKSAKATREQVAEAKRQFEESNRAFVTVTFEIVRSGVLVLQIKNEGHRIAEKVKIRLSPEFIANLPDGFVKNHAEILCNTAFTLGIGQTKYLHLGGNLQLKDIAKELLSVEISYQDSFSEYNETSIIDLTQYFWQLLYESPTADAYQEMKKISKELQSINRSLQHIDRHLQSYESEANNA